jgi:hypothetical protein
MQVRGGSLRLCKVEGESPIEVWRFCLIDKGRAHVAYLIDKGRAHAGRFSDFSPPSCCS